MKKGKKQQSAWESLGKSVLLALGVYLLGHLLLAALMVRGSVGEDRAFWGTGTLCLLAAFLSGLYAARHTPWGAVRGGLFGGLLFGVTLALVGMACWQSLCWTGQSGVLMLCALSGGFFGGVCGGRKKTKRRVRL